MNRLTREEWIAKYYPKEASKTSKEESLDHTILKWTGLLEENLPEYLSEGLNTAPVIVDSSTCALCHHYFDEEDECVKCPLAIVRGGVNCAEDMKGESMNPYHFYHKCGDARPMLEWLMKVKEYENK
jgi:hypothetical protein